jgi:hypothetical protein
MCSITSLGQANARWRRTWLALQFGVSVGFAVWLAQCYLPKLGPSFGQRQVVEAFYRDRTSASEPLIAYHLNWKGENFYTGNHLAIFVSSGKPFRRYLRQRAVTDPVVHVVLETQRLARLRAELGPVDSFDVLTDRRHSDKISLVRVRLRQGPQVARSSGGDDGGGYAVPAKRSDGERGRVSDGEPPAQAQERP